MILRSIVLCAVCALWGCTLETGRSGESCRRSTQCSAGLACVRGKCTKDLGPIADESTVPDLGMGMGTGMAAAEGGVAAADGGGMPSAGNASNAGSAAGGGGTGGGS